MFCLTWVHWLVFTVLSKKGRCYIWIWLPSRVIFFNNGFNSDPTKLFPSIVQVTNKLTMVSIVASIVISKFLYYTILVTISGKRFFQQNFNLKMKRIQHGVDLGCCWMLFFSVEKGVLARPWRMLCNWGLTWVVIVSSIFSFIINFPSNIYHTVVHPTFYHLIK
jgi:hypothetical protein